MCNLLHLQLSEEFGKYNLLYDGHFGFRKSSDMDSAVLDFITHIQLDMDSSKKCSILSLDLRKTFYTLDHHILLNVLKKIGMRGCAHDCFVIIFRLESNMNLWMKETN